MPFKTFVLKFGRAYWPALLPWLLILAIAPLRELARFQVMGSAVSLRFNWQPWAPKTWAPSPTSPEPDTDLLALRDGQVDDFDHVMTRTWQQTSRGTGEYDGCRDVSRQLQDVLRRYPKVEWLPTYSVWALLACSNLGPPQDLDAAAAMTHEARLREPNNSVPLIAAALWECCRLERQRRGGGSSQGEAATEETVLALIHQAAAKPLCDTHELDAYGCLLRAAQSHGPLTYEEKVNVMAEGSGDQFEAIQVLSTWCLQRARNFRAEGDASRALHISLDVAHLGQLMRLGRNELLFGECGSILIEQSVLLFPVSRQGHAAQPGLTTSLAPGPKFSDWLFPSKDPSLPVIATPIGVGSPYRNEAEKQWPIFDRYARAHGLSSIATEVRACSGQSSAVRLYFQDASMVGKVQQGALYRASCWWLDLSAEILSQGLILLPAWLAIAVVCLPGIGHPSTRPDRARVALFCLAICVGSALLGGLGKREVWIEQGMSFYSRSLWTNLWLTATMVGRWAPIPFCWLTCAVWTLLRRRRALVSERGHVPIGSSELAASAPALRWVQWFQIGMAYYPFITLGVVWSAWPLVGLLEMTGEATGINIPWNSPFASPLQLGELTGWLLILVLRQAGFCLFLWFVLWRWFASGTRKPLALAAIRWFKESLGCYLVLLSWAYLFVLIAQMPARAASERQLDSILRHGPVGALYENKP